MGWQQIGDVADRVVYAEDEMLFGARMILRNEGEQVEIIDGVYYVGGVAQTPDEVIAYANDLKMVEHGRPLTPWGSRPGKKRRIGKINHG